MSSFTQKETWTYLIACLFITACGEKYQPVKLNGANQSQAERGSMATAGENRQSTLAGVVDGWKNTPPPQENSASAPVWGEKFFSAIQGTSDAPQTERPPARQMPINSFDPTPTITLEKRRGDMAGRRAGDIASELSK